jgi:protein-histidine pros-kinase
LYLARPITITDNACLACHGDPASAPKTLLKKYGPANGFGWKLNEIIGAQIVSVPLSGALEEARLAFVVFMGLLLVMFATFIIVLNAMLKSVVIRPATTMSEIADQVSKGDLDVPAFDVSGKDEMATLAGSFNRMRRSLEKAMRMLEK